MVVFTCGHCGESVQKPKVEKHYLTKCRNRNPNLSCMDCFKDFLGQDYESHTKCITEEERYSGKGFMAKEKKGEKKQNTWVEMLQSVLDEQTGAPKNVLRIIETISKHTNTPRKKPKFINFVKNVCGHKTNPSDIDQAWDLISVKLTALSAVTQNGKANNNVPATNGEKVIETEKCNGDLENNSKTSEIDQSTENGVQNGDAEHTKETTEEKNEENEKENVDSGNQKKLSKKQRKQEKKRQKYEAELQSAAAPHEKEEVEEAEVKKGKKKKNRTESTNGDVEESEESKKQKKRKRQDTVNSVNGVHETEVIDKVNDTESEVVVKEKTKKKKQRVDSVEKAEESVCLHDQNVATIEEAAEQGSETFNWHAVIMSVLEKKGNEVQFKRLQKKVLSEYSEATGRDVDDRIAEKFIKKIKKRT